MKQEHNSINKALIPSYVTHVTETLEKAGFEAFIVGGCVRDLMLGRTPKDWDVTTNATPEEIIQWLKDDAESDILGDASQEAVEGAVKVDEKFAAAWVEKVD